MTYTRLVAAAAAVGVLVLGACTGGADHRGPLRRRPARRRDLLRGRSPRVAMTESHRYADGVTVGVKGYTDLTMNAANVIEGAEEGDPYVIITLLWANKGASKVDLTPLIVVRSGSAATEAPGFTTTNPESSSPSTPATRPSTTSAWSCRPRSRTR